MVLYRNLSRSLRYTLHATRCKTVMVFGVFDVLHPGHLSFLRQAQEMGERLIVVVARDSVVKRLKGKTPHFSERARMEHVKKELKNGVTVVLGDRTRGAYSVIKKYKPDCICLGYDQRALAVDLRSRMRRGFLRRIRFIHLRAHKPHQYHTSKLREP